MLVRVYGLGFGVWDLGFMVCGLGRSCAFHSKTECADLTRFRIAS